MSIDHGKLLALAEEIYNSKGLVDGYLVGPELRANWAERLRALAQPAEAVEDLENAAWTCPNGHSWQEWPKHLGCPDCATHDAAQGAVAIGCDWPNEGRFTVQDEPDEHAPCWLVMPGGAMLALNHHAKNGVDQARAAFIADACNAALDGQQTSVSVPTCKVCLRSIENCGEPLCPGKFRATHPQAAPTLMSSQDDWTVLDCPHCGKCVTYSKKAASSKDAYRDLTQEVESLRERLGQAAPAQEGES